MAGEVLHNRRTGLLPPSSDPAQIQPDDWIADHDIDSAALKATLAIATGDISGLTTALAAKADLSGGHVVAGQMPGLTGPITAAAGGIATAITAGAVGTTELAAAGTTNAKLANMAANTLKGSVAGGVPADLTATQAKSVLAIAAGDVSGLAATATSTDAANLTGSLAAARMPALTGDVTTSAGAVATTIGAHKVTVGMLAQAATLTLLGNNTGGTADIAALTVAQILTMLAIAAVLPDDCGDGRDGSATLDGTNTVTWATKSGNTYTMTTNAQLSALTITSSPAVTLKTAGWALRCKTAIVNNGTIDCAGGNAAGTTDGAAPIGATTLFPQTLASATNSTSAPQCFVAGSAANNGASVGGGGSSGGNATAGTTGRGGGGGGGGNNGAPFTVQGAAGLSSPTVALASAAVGDICAAPIASSGRQHNAAAFTLGTWGGKGGDGTAASSGGGRGAAGGYIYICAPGISGAGTITVAGGNGGAGTAATAASNGGGGGGGGGGAGGLLVLKLSGYTNTNTTVIAGGALGAGGAHDGAGGNGGNGAAGGSGALLLL